MDDAHGFPVDAQLPALCALLETQCRVVLEAPPGAGKTTRVPPALLAARWCTGRVLMLEPRRIAARAAASYMAAQMNEAVGATVGYRIRFERRVSAATRIEVVTEGILTRMLQDDPALDGVSAVIFDEFHERHLAGDLGLALCLDVQQALRPDLRIVVMSATLDGEQLAAWLQAPRIRAEGRAWPVDVEYLPAQSRESAAAHLRRAAARAIDETDGDVLCFLPGLAEIRRAGEALAGLGVTIETLHGELSPAAQARVLQPAVTRRIVLATNVAESSVTLPGVRAVVDSGLAREPRFDPVSGMSRLQTVNVTQASATQRAGRAGRVTAGRCYRLWPQGRVLEANTRAEITQVELSGLLLELKVWGSEALRFPDAPPAGAMAQAADVLRVLGALDAQGRLTAHGRAMATLGTHPRLASMMLSAPPELAATACDVAALLEGRDPLRGEARFDDRLQRRLAALGALHEGARPEPEAAPGVLRGIAQAARAWRRRRGLQPDAAGGDGEASGQLVALAYPERIAHLAPGAVTRYRLAGGRGARLADDSALAGLPWLAVASLRAEPGDSLVQLAAPLEQDWLEQAFAERFEEITECAFNPDSGAVEAVHERRFGAIAVARRVSTAPRNAGTTALLLEGLAARGVAPLPWTADLRTWQARVQCLRSWCPELGLPDLGDDVLGAELATWLAPFVTGHARLDEITSAELTAALAARLDHGMQRALDEYAPRRLAVPSGRRHALAYRVGEAPVLAVKLQELFGLGETPRIARGRVPVTLHLLSPRGIPIQVTQDLRGFWERTYAEVRKELKGRYPKHPWPDDPWRAEPTHRTRRR